MKIHIWIDKKDVQGLAKGTDKIIEFWYRKPSFPKKYKDKETVMVSISPEEFQLLLDNQEAERYDTQDDIMIDQGFGD
jgi:hypothetical protein|tara:strand:+ start:272 stop:505 length:234 start_codon:yes stop_codon:yes gene_type:complete